MALTTSSPQSPSTGSIPHVVASTPRVLELLARIVAAARRPRVTLDAPRLYVIGSSFVVVTGVAVAGVFHR